MRIAFGLILVAAPAFAGNWPQWRGPTGDGVCSDTTLPVTWDAKSNIAWKCPLPEGASTPAIWGDAIFVTGQDSDKLLLFRIDRDSGKVVWSRQVASGRMTKGSPRGGRIERGSQKFHTLHNLASPSPVTDGEIVVVHFGSGDLAAYDFAGKQLWHRNLQTDHGPYTIWWGHANSPMMVGDLVINACMQDSLADLPGRARVESYIVAHDKKTGEQKWKTLRDTGAPKEEADSYTTPIVRTVNGRTEVVVMGGNQLDAYDPITGKQLWRLPGLTGGRTVTGPILGNDVIFATRGKREPFIAVRPIADGELSRSSIVWECNKGTADSSSPVLYDGMLFWITDNGVCNCLDAKTGKVHWSQRVLQGDCKASPIIASGRLYFLTLDGRCAVIAAKSSFEKLAENSIGEDVISSPAAADGRLLIRGRKHLFCIKTP